MTNIPLDWVLDKSPDQIRSWKVSLWEAISATATNISGLINNPNWTQFDSFTDQLSISKVINSDHTTRYSIPNEKRNEFLSGLWINDDLWKGKTITITSSSHHKDCFDVIIISDRTASELH